MIQDNFSIPQLTRSPLEIDSQSDRLYSSNDPLNKSNFNLLSSSSSSLPLFDSGVFTVNSSGKVTIDYLFDGGAYQGELAIFSLQGMGYFASNYQDFSQEAARRALSNSNLGYVVIDDLIQGAKFGDLVRQTNWNFGEYKGSKTFDLLAGDSFGFMLVPNGTVKDIVDGNAIATSQLPIFSMATANPDDIFYLGQIADVKGNSNIFAMEDWLVSKGGDRDYDDIIFQVQGATGKAVDLKAVINPEYNWINSDLWQQLQTIDAPKTPPILDYEPGQLLVKFDAALTEKEISAIASSYGAISVEKFSPLNLRTPSPLAQWRVIHLADNVDIEQALSMIGNHSDVEAAELNHKIFLLAQPNDPQFNQQWGFNNTGQTGGKPLADINAPEAWDVQTGSRSIKVAVIDSGIDYNHQDLAANIWRNTGEIANNGIDDDGNGYIDDVQGYDFINKDSDPMDDWDNDPLNQEFLGHGTHVAGIIGAVGNNNIGISGVAQQVSLMPLKFANGESGTARTAADAIIYAINNGAKIINGSWGTDRFSRLLDDAVKAANNANILFVAAAGNWGSDNDQQPFYPANSNLPNVITVASTNSNDQLSSFSNYGQFTVDIAAPGGEDVTDTNAEDILSTTPNNTYSYKNGTSMAAPFVVGAAALLLGENRNLTAEQLKNILMTTVAPLPSLQGNIVSGGRLNLQNALQQVQTINQLTSPFSQFSTSSSGGMRGSSIWGDYNNDNNLDILLTGLYTPAQIRRNDGNKFTSSADLPSLYDATAAWGDYDNDNDLDLVISKNLMNGKIYTNDNGAFSDIGVSLMAISNGVFRGSVEGGDYDNDGDLDLLMTGESRQGVGSSKIYRNDGNNSFTDISASLIGVMGGSATWGDYDNDGDLDILLTGWKGYGQNGSSTTKIYRNDGAANSLGWNFTDINAPLKNVHYSSAVWGDYDNDGDLDILITGSNSFGSNIYRNEGGDRFTNIRAPLPDLMDSAVKWGDYDNDGDLDILLTGWSQADGKTISKIYQNNRGSFTELNLSLTGISKGSVDWGDYDKDGDLDILLNGQPAPGQISGIFEIYQNNALRVNTVPTAPTVLNTLVNNNSVTFGWNPATDEQTPQKGLTYNLRVGTTPGGSQIMSPMASSDGTRKVVEMGNVNQNTSWTLRNLQPGTYYWSVQAIDTSFAGSPFATEGTFTVV